MAGDGALAAVVAVGAKVFEARGFDAEVPAGLEPESPAPETWRISPLASLPPARFILSQIWMIVLRGYLIIPGGIVLIPVFELATTGA